MGPEHERFLLTSMWMGLGPPQYLLSGRWFPPALFFPYWRPWWLSISNSCGRGGIRTSPFFFNTRQIRNVTIFSSLSWQRCKQRVWWSSGGAWRRRQAAGRIADQTKVTSSWLRDVFCLEKLIFSHCILWLVVSSAAIKQARQLIIQALAGAWLFFPFSFVSSSAEHLSSR